MNSIELGKLLKLTRQQKGFTQEQLSETLSVTTSAISKWQNDTFVSESIIYQKMSFYKDYEAALAFGTPDQSFYLVRHK